MTFPVRPFIFAFGALLLGLRVSAESIYISQTAQGSDTGADAANAHSLAWANDAGNWDTDVADDGKIGPGDTVVLNGTLTAQWEIKGSGTSGNAITIMFASGAKFSAPYWTATGAIYAQSRSYIRITSGQSADTDAERRLMTANVEATANGEGLANAVAGSRGIYFLQVSAACTGITIDHISVQNLYVKLFNSTDFVDSGNNLVVEGDQIAVDNCYLLQGNTGIYVKSTVVGGELHVRGNTILRASNSIKYATKSAPDSVTAGSILRNIFDDHDWWGGGIGNSHHHNDGIQTITQAGGDGLGIEGVTIAYNHGGPDVGTNGHTTALIYLEDYVSGLLIYNNYMEIEPGGYLLGAIVGGGNGLGGNGLLHRVYNNTISGASTSTGIGMGYSHLAGNIVLNMDTALKIRKATSIDVGGTSDYNVYFPNTSDVYFDRATNQWVTHSSISNFVAHADSAGRDDNSISTLDPLLNSDGTLQSGSPAIDFAPSQSAYFTDDFFGNTRTGSWDAGAFEYGAGVAAAPDAPTSPTLSVIGPRGFTIAWTDASDDEANFDVQYRIGAGGWTEVQVAANSTSASVVTLAHSTTYEVQVRSTNGAGSSDWVAATPTSIATGAPAPVYRGRGAGGLGATP
jgi:hypothetical protein